MNNSMWIDSLITCGVIIKVKNNIRKVICNSDININKVWQKMIDINNNEREINKVKNDLLLEIIANIIIFYNTNNCNINNIDCEIFVNDYIEICKIRYKWSNYTQGCINYILNYLNDLIYEDAHIWDMNELKVMDAKDSKFIKSNSMDFESLTYDRINGVVNFKTLSGEETGIIIIKNERYTKFKAESLNDEFKIWEIITKRDYDLVIICDMLGETKIKTLKHLIYKNILNNKNILSILEIMGLLDFKNSARLIDKTDVDMILNSDIKLEKLIVTLLGDCKIDNIYLLEFIAGILNKKDISQDKIDRLTDLLRVHSQIVYNSNHEGNTMYSMIFSIIDNIKLNIEDVLKDLSFVKIKDIEKISYKRNVYLVLGGDLLGTKLLVLDLDKDSSSAYNIKQSKHKYIGIDLDGIIHFNVHKDLDKYIVLIK